MLDPVVQGQPGAEPAAPVVQGQPPTEPAALSGLESIVVSPEPAATPAALQGEPQGQPIEPTQGTQIDSMAQHFQRIADQRQAEIYRLQQQLNEVQRPAAPQAEQNPYDPNTNFYAWQSWETNNSAMKAARLASQETEQRFTARLAQAIQQQAEVQWQQSHPGVDINMLKSVVQTRWGVQNPTLAMIEDAYSLLNFPQQANQLRTQAIQQTFNSFKQPQSGAQPIRGAVGAGPQVIGVSLAKAMEEYAINPAIADTWPPEFQREFFKAVNYEKRKAHGG